MKEEDLEVGRTYYLPVAYTKAPKNVTGGGNMIRCVTQDDGSVVWVRPGALIKAPEKGEDNAR